MKKYIKRIADEILANKLESIGAILIEGPKWCGKTTTAIYNSKSFIRMDDPEMANQYLEMAQLEPSTLLVGDTPHLIDEWQLEPKIWNAVRYEVDERGEFGQFILTGSSVPKKLDKSIHSGTGRIARMKMRTMSLFESGDSTGDVSLNELFNGRIPKATGKKFTINEIAYLICRGGWPLAINQNEKIALKQASNYYDSLINQDILRDEETKLDIERAKRIIRSYARNLAQDVPMETIRKDVISNDEESFSSSTLYEYLSFLNRIFVLEDSRAWNPNLRSKTAIRSTDTRYFLDPSIGVASLDLGPNDLINDLNTMGLFFENMCIRDLRIYSDTLDGQVYHYRDKSGLECDAVIHLKNGDYGLIEIKLGGTKLIEEGAANLIQLANKIDTTKMKKPSFSMVLIGVGDIAYQRKDGVYVVPIGCLKN